LFTDEKNSTWKNWYEKIQNKLKINVDLFFNERVKLSYVHSRLFNDAAEITQARCKRDYVNLYRIVDDLLKELAQLFNDLNKKVNFRKEYYNLIQESKKFSKFYTQFQQLSFYLKYHKKQLIIDLKDKINSCLWFIWIDQLVQSDSLKEICFYLIYLNNDQRVIWKIKNKVISLKVIKKIKIISLCKLDEILSEENYFERLFLIDIFLNSQNQSFSLCSLINSDSVTYMLIHDNLVNKVCKKLEIQSISLTKEKLIKDYDEKIFKKIITHKILLNLIIESHKKLTVSMLIADIDHHEVILSKLWMNKNEILLNMQNDIIVFSNQLNTSISIFLISLNSKHLSWSRSTSLSFIIQTKIFIMLKWSVSTTTKKESFLIQSINAASFKMLLNHSKKN